MKSIKKIKPYYWDDAKKYLKNVDPVLSKIIDHDGASSYLTSRYTVFNTFFKIIIGQQISIEAASSIEKKIKEHIKSITPKAFLDATELELRQCGLSYRKIKYIKGIAVLCKKNSKYFIDLRDLSDYEAIKKMIRLYGIGPWSAEMFLIFNFNRANILPIGDIGLINSFCKNYNVQKELFSNKIDEYRQIWSPYCTVATWYLWRDIDEEVVQY